MIKNVWSILFPPNLHLLHLLYHLEASPGRYFSSFVVVQLLTCVWLFAIPWTAARQASLSFTVSQSLLKLIFIESVMPSNHLVLCHCLLLLPSVFPIIRVISSESALRIRWPKYWSFGFSISPSNEYSGLISFRMDWFDLLPVQGTLKSLLQHRSLKASILWHSDFMVQLSHSNMTKYKRPGLVRSLGQEDPLQKGMATHSSILAWKFHGQRRLAGYTPWGLKELDMAERLTIWIWGPLSAKYYLCFLMCCLALS